ncbi:hypothetical protein PVAG01_05162 [Phlyctema vagabunda]|uniref:Uncharacterized protein n=1 Tax=Phlyctema vagabunda TaxID=108571 RepID=A0ABR4PJD0_9HELO
MAPLTFLDLPSEIRIQIYRLLLTIPSPSTPRILGSDQTIYTGLILLSRRIFEEASVVLYGENTFLAHPSLLAGLPRLRMYLDPIRSSQLIARIRRFHIRVRLDNDPNFSARAARQAFSHMEELTVEVFQAQYGSSDNKVLRLFEDIRGVKRARVYGSILAFPKYAKWLEHAMMSCEGVRIEDPGVIETGIVQ